MFSKSTILARPGWCPLNFDELLGEPDDRRPNRGMPPMSFYTKERVLAAEASPRFQELRQAFRVNSFRVMNGLISQTDEFAAPVEDMQIDVVAFTFKRVSEGAIGHYNADRTANFVTRRSDRDLLNRIMVEYARDVLTRYDRELEAKAKAAGSTRAVSLIRKTVYHAIASTYPELARECFIQIDRGM
jgi:hypothetical protein